MDIGSIIAKAVGGSAGTLIKDVGSTVKKFVTTKGDQMQMQLELEELLQKRDSEVEETIRTELNAKAEIIKAEMASGDNYTKRARPTVVYYGLVAITGDLIIRAVMWFNEVSEVPLTLLPDQFWWAWTGLVGTWIVGRSAEKRGNRNKVTDFITGG